MCTVLLWKPVQTYKKTKKIEKRRMGCGNSKLVHDGSSEIMPSKLAPLLRNQLENMRRRHRVADAMTLKRSTLSTKELLKDSAAPDSSEDTSSKPDREYEEDDRNSLCCHPAAKPLDEKKGGTEAQPEEISMKNKVDDDDEERQGQREERVIVAVTAAVEQVSGEEENKEAKKGDHSNVEDEGDEDDNDDSEMRVLSKSLLHGDDICPGSPSFRVYCTAPISMDSDNDTDEGELPPRSFTSLII